MPMQWMTVAEAAAQLKVHPRTIERRIASGKLDAKRADDGQIQVAIDSAEPPPSAGTVPAEAIEAVRDLADRQVDLAAGSASAIVRLSQQAADRATQDLLVVRTQLVIAQRQCRTAWAAVGVAACIFPVAVMLVVNVMNRATLDARAEARVKGDELDGKARQVVQLEAERDEARQEVQAADVACAKADGELAAYKVELADSVKVIQAQHPSPATRPAGLLDRLAQALTR